MDIRKMLRQYAQYNPHRCAVLGLTKQSHHTRLVGNDALDWCIDFERALDQLAGRDRTLLLLVFGAGFAHAEAARLTGTRPRTVAYRIAAAERSLRDALEAHHEALEGSQHSRRPCRPSLVLRGVAEASSPFAR